MVEYNISVVVESGCFTSEVTVCFEDDVRISGANGGTGNGSVENKRQWL